MLQLRMNWWHMLLSKRCRLQLFGCDRAAVLLLIVNADYLVPVAVIRLNQN